MLMIADGRFAVMLEPGPCSSLAEGCPERASSVEDDAVRLKKRVVVIFRLDINDTTTMGTEECVTRWECKKVS